MEVLKKLSSYLRGYRLIQENNLTIYTRSTLRRLTTRFVLSKIYVFLKI